MKKSISFSSKFENIDLAEKFITTICEYEDIDERYFGNIIIAVTESVNNAIVHGNKENPEKDVNLHYFLNGKELGFVVEDQGEGFNFDIIPDPTLPENIEKLSGRGIFLMKSLADEVCFTKDGRSVEMKFDITNG
ncbi:MAG: ATP-binding protein [Crocinitomicaceae bacterium]|nr:ATP-binding protein [Crocinitomicaceae bacterium]|tara:strand:- start:6318 stop:6722 length:405 start_codon:yes stop_codon:yes gene_type:complete